MKELKRRDLSGIYIFDKFQTDERRKPTCVEDCAQNTRRKWCMSKNEEYLRNVVRMECETFKDLCDYLLKEECLTEEQHGELARLAERTIMSSVEASSTLELAELVDFVCDKLTTLADYCGVTKHIEDDEE